MHSIRAQLKIVIIINNEKSKESSYKMIIKINSK